MVDAKVSKTFGPQDHAGSIPAPGTTLALRLRIVSIYHERSIPARK